MEERDRFGFKSEDSLKISEAMLKRDNARLEKWLEMFPQLDKLIQN